MLSLCMAYKAWEMERESLFETELPCGPENKNQVKPETLSLFGRSNGTRNGPGSRQKRPVHRLAEKWAWQEAELRRPSSREREKHSRPQ